MKSIAEYGPTNRLRVALLAEGTYPHHDGGVSTWSHVLCERLPEVTFSIYNVTGSPRPMRYRPPSNVERVVQLPQWGTEDIVQFAQPHVRGWRYLWRAVSTARTAADPAFLRLFGQLVDCILRPEQTVAADADIILQLHDWFQRCDYTSAFRSPAVWACFRDRVAQHRWSSLVSSGQPQVSALEVATALRWLHNFLTPLAVPVPAMDVIHATVAGTVGLIGVIGKLERGIPFLLTEHGVYVRERYINLARGTLSWFLSRIAVGVSGMAARLCYAHADVISPVCHFNTRWEQQLGAARDRIQVIYNGIDAGLFQPCPKPQSTAGRPTAIMAGRVYPLKDVLTLIRAAALARERVPNLRVIVYGATDADPPYTEQCRKLITELQLNETLQLAGNHPRPHEMYVEGDITVLSSISEGFPYVVIESMACERPVVATDVGGVREAIADTGVVVPPKDPAALAQGMVTLLANPAHRAELGRRARERVLAQFVTENVLDNYWDLYHRLVNRERSGLGAAGHWPVAAMSV